MVQRSARGLKYHSFSHFSYPECPQNIMGLFWGTKVIRKVSSLINFKLLSLLTSVKKKGEKEKDVDFWVKTYLESLRMSRIKVQSSEKSPLINFKLLSFLVKKKEEKYVDFWVKTY